uniref:PGG domain-containing protein n=1 Tax=Setaria viridis TaxID=4556 RepID=A0A4U6UWF2_SETVI|nr:hypothetical protein SEVIR_4G189300v2 [Setaria viridis]
METVQPRLSSEEIENSEAHGENNGQIPTVTGISSSRQGIVGSTQDCYEHLWKLRKYLVLLGTLAVSVTYNSGLTPPGGFCKSVARQELWLRSMQFTMLVDLFSLMGAYAAGSCRALKSSIYTWF